MAALTGASQNGLYMLAQDRLSTGGNFVLCDACVDRCPIRFSSPGFEDLFGYKTIECFGKNCGDLVGKQAILVKDPGLTRVAEASGLTPKQVAAALDCQLVRLGEQTQRLLTYPRAANRVTFGIALNVTKNGDFRVIELVTMSCQLPIGLPYLVGIQHDVTDEISIGQFLHAELENEIGKLAESRQAAVCETLALLGTTTPMVKRYLDAKAVDVWSAWLNSLPEHDHDDKSQFGTSKASEAGAEECTTQSGKGAQDSEAKFASLWQNEIAQQGCSLNLSHSVSSAGRSAGQPAVTLRRVKQSCDASTQTEKLAALLPCPPRPPSVEREAKHERAEDFQRARQLRTFAKVPSTNRALTFDLFSETPSEMMTQHIFEPALSINPRSPLGCCSLHKNLKVMRQHIGLMMQSVHCQNFSSENFLQCVECSHVQIIGNEEFQCDRCDGEVSKGTVSNEASSDAQADDEM